MLIRRLLSTQDTMNESELDAGYPPRARRRNTKWTLAIHPRQSMMIFRRSRKCWDKCQRLLALSKPAQRLAASRTVILQKLVVRAGFIAVAEDGACMMLQFGCVPKCSAPLYAPSFCSAHGFRRESPESERAGTGRVAVVKLSSGVGKRGGR